ncbi:MAG: exodeoxyribonuclease VII small subunit [Candidatus Omnitrophica bacterium]|nr:exodeoxyribonuclease VII small subunit [Candidatus Omnitrophota bacterium]
MAEKKLTYSQAAAEIESIVKEIEEEDVEVDHLLEKVKRASFLIKYCKEKLRDTEAEVRKVLAAQENGEAKEQE